MTVAELELRVQAKTESDGWHKEAWILSLFCNGKGVEIGSGRRKAVEIAKTVDKFEKGSAECENYGSKPDIICPADKLPFDNDELDFIASNHLLEHIKDPVNCLREWHRVLKPGGIVVFNVPDCEGLWTAQHKSIFELNREHKYITTPAIMDEFFRLAGGFEKELPFELHPVKDWSFFQVWRKK